MKPICSTRSLDKDFMVKYFSFSCNGQATVICDIQGIINYLGLNSKGKNIDV